MGKNPLVSIIIPTYKRSDMLGRAINSCLNQSYKNLEVIVVDDNNPDTEYRKLTSEFMKKYAKNRKVRYVKRDKNGGGSLARNTGIAEAKGEYITFLDDDDEYLKNKIEKQVDFIVTGKYDVIFSNYFAYYDDTKFKQEFRYNRDFTLDFKGVLTKHLVDVISGTSSFMYKKYVLDEIGGFSNIAANQEYVLMLKTIAGKYKLGYLNHAGTIQHFHSSEVRISNNPKVIDAKIEVIKLIKPYLKFVDKKDRRKTLFRLNMFVFYQSLKRKDMRFIKYGLYLLPYPDLIVRSILVKNSLDKRKIVYK